LPSGAVYTARDGPTSVKVGRNEKGYIKITARCDSIQQRVEIYQDSIIRLKEQKDSLIYTRRDSLSIQKSVPVGISFKTGFKWFLIGLISGTILAYLTKVLITKKLI